MIDGARLRRIASLAADWAAPFGAADWPLLHRDLSVGERRPGWSVNGNSQMVRAADGWMEVDRSTLRHKRFPNVFGVGDVAGVPKGKTAASVKWQVPVAVSHLIGDITGKASSASYNGYTSCPLITRLGRAMLVEFDYQDNLITSFPGVVEPLEELWVTWVIKTMGLKPTYLTMLRGRA